MKREPKYKLAYRITLEKEVKPRHFVWTSLGRFATREFAIKTAEEHPAFKSGEFDTVKMFRVRVSPRRYAELLAKEAQ